MQISVCLPYHSRTVGRKLIHMSDGKSAFKLYFISITGRQEPERYEWEHTSLNREEVTTQWEQSQRVRGIGFLTIFPHITKLFRFSPARETILEVHAFRTADQSPMDLSLGGSSLGDSSLGDSWMEFACYAEAAIAGDEYRAWAQAESVGEYLRSFSDFGDGPITSHDKLARWFAG